MPTTTKIHAVWRVSSSRGDHPIAFFEDSDDAEIYRGQCVRSYQNFMRSNAAVGLIDDTQYIVHHETLKRKRKA